MSDQRRVEAVKRSDLSKIKRPKPLKVPTPDGVQTFDNYALVGHIVGESELKVTSLGAVAGSPEQLMEIIRALEELSKNLVTMLQEGLNKIAEERAKERAKEPPTKGG
jgi:hypothetical protein